MGGEVRVEVVEVVEHHHGRVLGAADGVKLVVVALREERWRRGGCGGSEEAKREVQVDGERWSKVEGGGVSREEHNCALPRLEVLVLRALPPPSMLPPPQHKHTWHKFRKLCRVSKCSHSMSGSMSTMRCEGSNSILKASSFSGITPWGSRI